MNLIQIITLYNSGQLPATPAVLISCEKVLENANKLAFENWRTTSNPITARMLEKEQQRYEKILKWIRIKMNLARVPGQAKRATVQSLSIQPSL